MLKFGLQDDANEIILDIFKAYPQIEEVILFGSRALNTFKAASDIDFSIKGKGTSSILAVLIDDFEESDLIYEVDVVDYDSITSEKLLEHIDKHGTLFYRKGWVETTLGGVSSSKQYGYTESASTEKIGPKFLRITDIQHDFIDWNAVPYCPISEKDKLKYKLGVGDVVIARTGNSTGATATIKNASIDAVFASYLIRFKIDPQIADYNFIDFSLRSKRWSGFVKSIKGGSAQGGANANNFAEYPINLPPLPEQKAIADILSSFDEKTELLREQNKTLETLAQTIFKEWFVNFNYPDATGEMVDSELGEIPKGWRVGKLGSLIKTNASSISRNSELDVIQYLDTGSLTEGHIESTQKLQLADAPSRARRIVQHNDVLISTVRPNLKHYGIIKEPADNLIVSTGFCVITSDKIDPHFVYFLLTTNDMTDYLHSVAEGSTSTYPSIKPSDIESIEFVVPSENALKPFSDYADKAWNKIMFNQIQIKTLSKARDALLPKLMSGKVRV